MTNGKWTLRYLAALDGGPRGTWCSVQNLRDLEDCKKRLSMIRERNPGARVGQVQAIDPDRQLASAQLATGRSDPSDNDLDNVRAALFAEAVRPIASNPELREQLAGWVEDGLTDVLRTEGVGAIAFTPLAQGLLTGKYLADGTAERAQKRGSLPDKPLSEEGLAVLRGLNEIAVERGQSLAQMAKAKNEEPWDVFFKLVKAGAFALPESMSEENKLEAIREEFVSFCTDVGPSSSVIASHPRAYGSFPRLLSHYVRDLGTISLERAIAQLMQHSRSAASAAVAAVA